MIYADYLRSPEWYAIRGAALDRAEHACQVCNRKGRLHVHHRTYERLGHERLADLTVLCARCHAKFHDQLPPAEVPVPFAARSPSVAELSERQGGGWVPTTVLDL